MTVRPYPSAGRALRQILRRHRNQLPAAVLPGGREAAERLQAGLAAQPGAGDYVLSTRRR